MKKILLFIIGTLAFNVAFSQTIRPVYSPFTLQQFGNASTITKFNGVMYPVAGYAAALWVDTATANNSSLNIDNIPLFRISTTSDGKSWVRNLAATAWLEEINSGSSLPSGLVPTWQQTLNATAGSTLTTNNKITLGTTKFNIVGSGTDTIFKIDPVLRRYEFGDVGENYNATKIIINDDIDALGVYGTIQLQGTFKYPTGSQGLGKVLTSDASGYGYWQPNTLQTIFNNEVGGSVITKNDTIKSATTQSIVHVSTGAGFIGNETTMYPGTIVLSGPADNTTWPILLFKGGSSNLPFYSTGVHNRTSDGYHFYHQLFDRMNYLSWEMEDGHIPMVIWSTGSGYGNGGIEIGRMSGDTLVLGGGQYNNTLFAKTNIVSSLMIKDGSQGANKILQSDADGVTTWVAPTAIATNPPISSLTAATGTNSIDNGNFPQLWSWNSIAEDNALDLRSSTTVVDASASLLGAQFSGANSNSNVTTTSGNFENLKTGTNSINIAVNALSTSGTTNIGLQAAATGGTTNVAIAVPSGAGSVGIGTSTPATILHTVGTVRHATLGTASSDTTANKPLGIDSDGDIIPMTYWPGGGGVTTMAAIGSSPNANGATITGSTLNLEPASASFGGVVTTAAQTFAGNKTISNNNNGKADLRVSNTTTGTSAQAQISFTTDLGAEVAAIFKFSNTSTTYKNIAANDLGTYNATSGGNMSFLNDNASGNINFAAGSASAAQVTIASTGAVAFSTYGAGTATFDGLGNITSVSDGRAKHSIKKFGYGLKEILGLKTSTFIYNQDKSNTVMSGFIAQDVQKVMPTAVHEKNGVLSLETNAIIAALVEGMKEQQKQIDALKAEIKKLKN